MPMATKASAYPTMAMSSHARTTSRPAAASTEPARASQRPTVSFVSQGFVKPCGKTCTRSPASVTRYCPRYSLASQVRPASASRSASRKEKRGGGGGGGHHSAEVLTPLSLYRTHPVEALLNGARSALSVGLVTGLFAWSFGPALRAWEILGVDAIGFVWTLFGANLRHSHVWLSYGRCSSASP